MKITGKVVAMEVGPELEPAVSGFILRFAYHSPRMLRADCQFLLERIKKGTSFFKNEHYSLQVYKKSVVITLFKPESGHAVAKFGRTEFLEFLNDHHHVP